jgi:hypothetical protein
LELRSDRDEGERHMWYPRLLFTQMEGRPMDIADLADELEALVQEALDAGIEAAVIRETLAAKVAELHAEAGNEDTGEADEAEEPDEPA